MGAFRGAVEVGAEALETDVHLSKDGVVMLSHVSLCWVVHGEIANIEQDKDLKRCFGRNEKLIDCDSEFLTKLKTLKEPHQSMPRLVDLLEYLAQPGLEDIWVLLDIKVSLSIHVPYLHQSDTVCTARQRPRRYHARYRLRPLQRRPLPHAPLVFPHRPRHLGRKIPPPLPAAPPLLSRLSHRLLHCVRELLLRRVQRLFQHVPGRAHATVGPGLHPQGAVRWKAGVRVDSERGEEDALGYKAWD